MISLIVNKQIASVDRSGDRLRDFQLDLMGNVATWNLGRSGSKVTGRKRSSDAISKLSTRQRMSSSASKASAFRSNGARTLLEAEGWQVRKDGSRFWASRRDRSNNRRGWRPGRLCQDHARHYRTARKLGMNSRKFRNN